MSSIIRQLITELAGGAPGAVDAGPLSLEILAKKEKSVKNKKAMPIKLIKYDDDDMEQDTSDPTYGITDELDPDFDDNEDGEDDFDDGEDNPGDVDDMLDTDDDPVEEPTGDMTQTFQQFKQWLIQNSDLVDGGSTDTTADVEQLPSSEEFPEDDVTDDMGMGMYSQVPNHEEDEEPEMDDMEMNNSDDMEMDNMDDQDPDRQGVIRTVKGSHLVYKREQPDGFYEEMWFYNIGKDASRDELEIKKNILAGTDIKVNQTISDDGAQTYSIWSVGNGQMIRITGIPN